MWTKRSREDSLGRVMIISYLILISIIFITSVIIITWATFDKANPISDLNSIDYSTIISGSGLVTLYFIITLIPSLVIIFYRDKFIDIYFDILENNDLISILFVNIVLSLVFLITLFMKPMSFNYIAFFWSISSPFSIILFSAYEYSPLFKYNRWITVVSIFMMGVGYISAYTDYEFLKIIDIFFTVLGSILVAIAPQFKSARLIKSAEKVNSESHPD